MFFRKKIKQINVYAPCDGKVVYLPSVKDEVFSTKVLGDGIAILPTNGDFYAPISGRLTVLFPTGHAYGIHNEENDIDILVHIGLETSTSKNKLYTKCKKANDMVIENKDLIVKANLKKIKAEKFDLITPIVFTTDSMEKHRGVVMNTKIVEENKMVKKGDLLFVIVTK